MAYNQARKQAMAGRVTAALGGSVAGCKIAVLGLAFKPETDDMRDSPALDMIPLLLADGAEVTAYDPAAMEEAARLLPDQLAYAGSAADCLAGADAAVLLTEWNEFRALTPQSFIDQMKGRVLVDLRNVYDPRQMRAAGLTYSSIGRA